MRRLLPDLATSWDLKTIEAFDDPSVRLVGSFQDDAIRGATFIASDEWYLGYQYDNLPETSNYIKYINSVQAGDVFILSHRHGQGVKVDAIGIVLYYKDLPISDEPNDPNPKGSRICRVFKVAWTSRDLSLELPYKGFWEKGTSMSQGYKKSEILTKHIPEISDRGVQDPYKAVMKEVDKARHRFLRLALGTFGPRIY